MMSGHWPCEYTLTSAEIASLCQHALLEGNLCIVVASQCVCVCVCVCAILDVCCVTGL